VQWAANTGAALARWTVGGCWAALFLALRGRLGRVVRCLRRAAQLIDPRFECRNARFLRRNRLLRRCQLLEQRQDQRILLGMAQRTEVGARRHPAFRIDSPVIVSTVI
jgi:hypothetical protein